jgi:rhamnulokinase
LPGSKELYMDWSQHCRASIAVDLGAQSCRLSLLRWNHDTPHAKVVHRFPNAPIATDSGLHWDMQAIFDGVKRGLCACADLAPEGVASIGVDGWAVDYVRLDWNGTALGNPFCYRDERNVKAAEEFHRFFSRDELYALTGIQLLSLNTLYQLYADKLAGVDSSARWLNLPEYITHLLGGKAVSEYTNATHSQLVKLGTLQWSREIFEAASLDIAAAPEIVPTGSVVGSLTGELRELPAFHNTKLIVPACHDTASAIAAIPATGDDWAFISSGTWSLVGTVLHEPCVTAGAQQMNFTNLGGVGGTFCFLKNINGMWLLQQCIEESAQAGQNWTFEDLVRQCTALPAPSTLIDVDHPQLMLPGNMLGKINSQLEQEGGKTFSSVTKDAPLIANTIFHSLAQRYAEVLKAIGNITGKRLRRLFIVGGGGKNKLLNRLTAQRTGLQVIPGATECTTIGNFAIQIAALRGGREPSKGVKASDVAKIAETISLDCQPFSSAS